MRKSTFVRTLCYCIGLFCLLTLGLTCRPALGQETNPVLPSDPKDLMLLAAKSNSLTGPDVQPWHLKATYRLLDEQGNIKDQGTYEEFWASPTKYKRILASNSFSQTKYGTEKGILLSGDRDAAPSILTKMRDELIDPIAADKELIEQSTLTMEKHDLGTSTFLCLTVTGSNAPTKAAELLHSTYCLDANLPMLRISLHPGPVNRMIHNNILKFQGSYLARDLQAFPSGNPSLAVNPALTAHLDSVEPLHVINEADFIPPADAGPEPKLVAVSEGVARAFLLKHPNPVYPPIAQAARVSGTVVLNATIGTKGQVLSLGVISGPAMLQLAALSTVKKWTFKPYLLNGEPADISTTITVPFILPMINF